MIVSTVTQDINLTCVDWYYYSTKQQKELSKKDWSKSQKITNKRKILIYYESIPWYKIVHYHSWLIKIHEEDGYDDDGGPYTEMERFCKLMNLFFWCTPLIYKYYMLKQWKLA